MSTDEDDDLSAIWDQADEGDQDRQRVIRIAQVGLLVLALIIVGIVVLTRGGDDDGEAGGGSADTSESADGGSEGGTGDAAAAGDPAWPREIQNRPPALGSRGQPAGEVQVAAGTEPGVYVWNDFDGWHLWLVGGEGVGVVSGTITSNDPVAKAVPAVEGRGNVLAADKVVNFQLDPATGLAGVDFNPGFYAKQLVFTINGPDGPFDAAKVKVGGKAEVAPFPFVVSKEPQG